VRPSDHIPAYRLAGNVTLTGIGHVATFWRDAVREGAGGRGLVVDLRSTMYASFWRPEADMARKVVTMRVLHEADGVRKVVSHFNKATKGTIVRALLEAGDNPTSEDTSGHLLHRHVEDADRLCGRLRAERATDTGGGDPVDDVHPAHHLAEDRVATAVGR